MPREAIQIQGLTSFNKALRQMDSDLPKGLRIGLNAAVQIVVDAARPRIPRRSGRAARSLRASSTRTKARISAGGTKAKYFPWLDFGGQGPGGRPAKRPFYSDGRYVWKAFAEKRPQVQAALEKALADVARGAGLEVS